MAEHWLVWLVGTLVAAHVTFTEVIVGDCGGVVLLPPPPPHPDDNTQPDKTQKEPNRKKAFDN
ncbi:MAG TPA: hypothetical protein VMU57_01755 [Edaphobacter sp.]|uniref:hypothetical protein n=1 Tax=Edaphobacter sp. TaxID=1934404 RepID=UPI002C8B4592|nr:hypothetical protein [Edaphobacter sp.]HUZ93617.1 hypothetical protein [Edaphobacter sp.]